MILASDISLTLDSGRNDGAVMWNTCLPLRLDRTEDVCEDGADCLITVLNPEGGLYGGGALKDTLQMV